MALVSEAALLVTDATDRSFKYVIFEFDLFLGCFSWTYMPESYHLKKLPVQKSFFSVAV